MTKRKNPAVGVSTARAKCVVPGQRHLLSLNLSIPQGQAAFIVVFGNGVVELVASRAQVPGVRNA